MNYEESVRYLYSLGHEVLAAKYGLENITCLLEKLGNPELSFKSVIVAGTNGKGSVAAMIDSIARAAGHRCALFTSPHLVRIEERVQVDGEDIGESDFARLASRVREASEDLVAVGRLDAAPTFFEQVAAIALCYFQESGAALAVLEVGLGGRLDATNAIDRVLSVITSIDLDHQNILGNTIEEIAGEKAAIIVPGARAVIGRQAHQAAVEVLMRRCLETSVLPIFANAPAQIEAGERGRLTFDYESSHTFYSRIAIGLLGRHQADNAAAAIEAAEVLSESGFGVTRENIIDGLRDVRWPGRLEMIEDHPSVLLDGAHNPAGARALRAYLDEFWSGAITLVFGAMGDKDVDRMASELFDAARTVVLTRVRDSRAAGNARLGEAALNRARNVIFTETVKQALSWARSVSTRDGLVCVAGSLHLVGEVKRLMEEEDSQIAMLNET
ncbi:MAG TPA: folylpolyglutamate synthase/dihydrofolate synthase family protein [Blastocatellia bacterium]|nr:folylpolyglutamate synthase/dihydrofolate synthase family protein [Blastocatellia bacterium]